MSIAAIRMSRNEKQNHPKVWQALSNQYPCLEMGDDAGDFHIVTDDGRLIIVERKSPQDFLNGIRDNDRRLFNQAAKFRELTDYAYFVITGPIIPGPERKALILEHGKWKVTGWDYASVEGIKTSLAQKFGVFPEHCAGESDFIPCLGRIASRSPEPSYVLPPKNYIVLGPFGETPSGKRFTEAQKVGAQLLTAFSGIGPDRAIQIMQHFPDAASAIWYLTDMNWNGEKITGIGNGIKQQIVKQLGASLVLNGDGNETP